jgi:hypothetical protein
MPAPRELLTPRRLDAPRAVAAKAPTAATAQPRDARFGGLLDRALAVTPEVCQARAAADDRCG